MSLRGLSPGGQGLHCGVRLRRASPWAPAWPGHPPGSLSNLSLSTAAAFALIYISTQLQSRVPLPARERGRERGRTVRWRGNWGRGEKGSPQPPPAGREPFRGGHGLPSRTPLPLHPSCPPTINPLLAHIQQPWEPPCHPVGTVASSLCHAENQSPWNEHGGAGMAAPDLWPQTHLNHQRGARGSAGAAPVGVCT